MKKADAFAALLRDDVGNDELLEAFQCLRGETAEATRAWVLASGLRACRSALLEQVVGRALKENKGLAEKARSHIEKKETQDRDRVMLLRRKRQP
jgi:hypothetical protein